MAREKEETWKKSEEFSGSTTEADSLQSPEISHPTINNLRMN